tara:strand:- start:1583 stop:2668 length:1086 start_codon:yes stop_codon:yes gene_type:complete
MKNMKNSKFKILLLVVLIGGFGLLQNCGSDDDGGSAPPVVTIDKTVLQAAITTATTLLSDTTEGTAVGNYTVGSKTILQDAINLAQAIVDNASSTQAQVNAAVVSLNSAIDTYNAAIVEEIAPENLAGHWKFDGGTGTTVSDSSGNGFTGTFGSASADLAGADGTSVPVWTADRFGTANKALFFDKGAKVTIPYSGAINPQEITISVWIRIDEQRNNRFIGLQSWHGYKFEVQDANFPFFTANYTSGLYDKASVNNIAVDTNWYHLVVTYGGGEMSFYINGVLTNTEPSLDGALRTVSGHDLVFGVDSSQYDSVTTNYVDFTSVIPGAWGSYLHGALDEVRIYNTVLTAPQVTALNNAEKP